MLFLFFLFFCSEPVVCELWHLCGGQGTTSGSHFCYGEHRLNSGHQAVQCSNFLFVAHSITKSHLGEERVILAYTLRQGWNWSKNNGGMMVPGLLPSLGSAALLIQPRPTCWWMILLTVKKKKAARDILYLWRTKGLFKKIIDNIRQTLRTVVNRIKKERKKNENRAGLGGEGF